MADKEELSSTNSKRIVELRSLTDLIKAAFRDVFHNTIFFSQPDSAPSLSPTSSVSSFAGVGVGIVGAGGSGGAGGGGSGSSGGGGGSGGCFPPHAVSSSSSSSTSPFDASVSLGSVVFFKCDFVYVCGG